MVFSANKVPSEVGRKPLYLADHGGWEQFFKMMLKIFFRYFILHMYVQCTCTLRSLYDSCRGSSICGQIYQTFIHQILHWLHTTLPLCMWNRYLYCFFTCSATLAGGTQWLIHYYNCMSPMWLAFF